MPASHFDSSKIKNILFPTSRLVKCFLKSRGFHHIDEILQILKIYLFEKTPVLQAFLVIHSKQDMTITLTN